MKRFILTAAVCILGSVLSVKNTAQAQMMCNQPKDTFDRIYCQAKVLVRADDEMNASYKALMQRLAPRDRPTLKTTQRQWIVKRNKQCVTMNTSEGNIMSPKCSVDVTTQRLNFLNDRLRECQSSGCQPRKLEELGD